RAPATAATKTSRATPARTIFRITSPSNLLELAAFALGPPSLVSLAGSLANRAFRRWRRAPNDKRRHRAPCPLRAARDRRNTCATSQARRREVPLLPAQDQVGRCPQPFR